MHVIRNTQCTVMQPPSRHSCGAHVFRPDMLRCPMPPPAPSHPPTPSGSCHGRTLLAPGPSAEPVTAAAASAGEPTSLDPEASTALDMPKVDPRFAAEQLQARKIEAACRGNTRCIKDLCAKYRAC
jgi:hypothetical protein